MGIAQYRRWWLVAVLPVLAIGPVAAAQEAVFTVTRTDDPEPDGCRPDDCSLREAVEAANAQPGADVVAVPAGVIELVRVDRTPPITFTTDPGEGGAGQGLYATGEVLLRGAGRELTIIDLSRLPPRDERSWVGPGVLAENASLTVENLTVRNARAGVLAAFEAAVTFRSVSIVDNNSSALSVDNRRSGRPLLIDDSLFAHNAGGAVHYVGADRAAGGPAVQVRRSVFSDNGGDAVELFVPAGDSRGEYGYEALVEDSEFHRNRTGLRSRGNIRVSRSSFTGNTSVFPGGAMRFGELPVLLEQVLVENNNASELGGGPGFGGGVAAVDLTVRGSVFRGNRAGEGGGAINVATYGSGSAMLDVSGSVFVGNSAGRGGAIRVSSGSARLTNVTLNGNVAREVLHENGTSPGGEGAALYAGERATVALGHTTVVGNTGDFGAIYSRGRVDITGSTLADTVATGGSSAPNCVSVEGGVVVSGGFNLVDDDSCGFDTERDHLAEPGLGTLTPSGGTLAHVPLAGSPLIDGTGSALCPGLDQRGVARPVDGNRDGRALCDIGAVEALSGTVGRVSGLDRVATTVAVSQASFGDQQAGVVVLARSDGFADGLAGGPLAVAGDGPLLLTGRDGLDPLAEAELARVLPAGGEVVLLGGTAALRAAVEERVAELGFRPVRVAGADRYATAVAVARRLGDPALVLLASGTDFPDALSAGAAAATAGGAVLLTADDQLPAPTRAYLGERADVERVAVGGPAAAADPGAEPVVGPDRYATAVAVARRFHDQPASVGVASGQDFPDALAAGPDSAARGGPLLLSPPDRLPDLVADYLAEIAPTLTDTTGRVRVYGGEKAISLQVEADLDATLQP